MPIAIICTLVFGLAVGFVVGREAGMRIMYNHVIEISQAEDNDEKGESE